MNHLLSFDNQQVEILEVRGMGLRYNRDTERKAR